MKLILALALLLTAHSAFAFPTKPDSKFTQPSYCSKTDRDYSGDRYAEKVAICVRNVTTATKTRVYSNYKIPVGDRKDYTIDHLAPLSMGGSNKETNLWPQHKSISTAALEAQTYRKLDKGQITQKQALDIILKKKMGN